MQLSQNRKSKNQMTNKLITPTGKELLIVQLPDDAYNITMPEWEVYMGICYELPTIKGKSIKLDYLKGSKIISQIKELTDKQCEAFALYGNKTKFLLWLNRKGIEYNENSLIIEIK
jgi:hypothetical protein